jgi:glucokinase
MQRIVLALDLGGTNLRVAAVREDGEILVRVAELTSRSLTGESLTDQIIRVARGCQDRIRSNVGSITAIGAAVPATIDQSLGLLKQVPNLPALEGVRLRPILEAGLDMEAVLENDANAAAYGENWLGASRDLDDAICVTLGTGVGGGLILNGRPFFGKDGTAGEIGHIIVEREGVECGCGGRGCLEQYASATALIRNACEAGINVTSAYELAAIAKEGNVTAARLFEKMGSYLGIAFASLVNLLDPEMIVIGGGVAAAWELFMPSLNEQMRNRAFRLPLERVKIVRARLGDDAGILGAARSAFEKSGSVFGQ